MNEGTNLHPCPFCGGDVEFVKFDSRYYIAHKDRERKCILQWNRPAGTNEEKLAEFWNRRAYA